ncbi:MAG: hypothetical protein IPM23_05875 [Candidatus Melainabacteria bacterium]|nr:hypothetical protein [Candidatus Melainabacteria bacterium]
MSIVSRLRDGFARGTLRAILALILLGPVMASSGPAEGSESGMTPPDGPLLIAQTFRSRRYHHYYPSRHRGSPHRPAPAGVSGRDTRKMTTWEAPTRQDRKAEAEIEQAQIDYGPDDERAIKKMWEHAKRYYDTRDYEKAEAMADRILALSRKERGKTTIAGLDYDDVTKLKSDAHRKAIASGSDTRQHSYGNFVVEYGKAGEPPVRVISHSGGVSGQRVGPGVTYFDHDTFSSTIQNPSPAAPYSRSPFKKLRHRLHQSPLITQRRSPSGYPYSPVRIPIANPGFQDLNPSFEIYH